MASSEVAAVKAEAAAEAGLPMATAYQPYISSSTKQGCGVGPAAAGDRRLRRTPRREWLGKPTRSAGH